MSIERLLTTINGIAKDSNPESEKTDIVYGTVKSLNPLIVNINGFSNDLPSEFFILSEIVKKKTILIPQEDKDDIEITITEGLAQGDRVLMLRIMKGNSYYILQKV